MQSGGVPTSAKKRENCLPYHVIFVFWKTFYGWPTLSVLFNAILAFILCSIDVEPSDYQHLQPDSHGHAVLFFTGGVDHARSVVSIVAGAAISVVTLTFSLTVLSLQLASTNYSPRLLDEFLKDEVTKFALSVFLGTFVYAYVVLWNTTDGGEQGKDYVPVIAINVIFLHIFIVVGTFLRFLHHFIDGMRLERLLQKALLSLLDVARKDCELFPKLTALQRQALLKSASKDGKDLRTESQSLDDNDRAVDDQIVEVPEKAWRLVALKSGYIQGWNHRSIIDFASKNNVFFRYQCHVGHFVTEGTILCWAWFQGDKAVEARWRIEDEMNVNILDYLTQVANNGVRLGKVRTSDQDLGFGARQLTDVAVRSLSPGINDPESACQALDALSVAFSELAKRRLAHVRMSSDDGELWIWAPGLKFDYILSLCMDSIRIYGYKDPSVARRSLQFLADVGSIAAAHGCNERVQMVRNQLREWDRMVRKEFEEDSFEVKWFAEALKHAEHTLSHAMLDQLTDAADAQARPEEGLPVADDHSLLEGSVPSEVQFFETDVNKHKNVERPPVSSPAMDLGSALAADGRRNSLC